MPTSNMENKNTRQELERIRNAILDNVRRIGIPSAGSSVLGTSLPPHLGLDISAARQAAEDANPDKHLST